jgi:SAM-dependent methyltransferase
LLDGNIYNLVPPTTDRIEEQQFYDATYSRDERAVLRSVAETAELWECPNQPEIAVMRRATGDVHGKDILLLGNGASEKELAFLLDGPRTLVYSDLSPLACRRIQGIYDFNEYRERVIFSALDAQAIPFCVDSFDVIYGYAMVHHLPRIDVFIAQVNRVLRPGGKAVFMDDAYAPLWHFAKQTILKPLMRYSHRRTGISPEDYRFSMSGGFKEEELAEKIAATGATPWFERTSFVTYIVFRAMEKLLSKEFAARASEGALPRITTAIDRALAHLAAFRGNQIRLIWGFSKKSSA